MSDFSDRHGEWGAPLPPRSTKHGKRGRQSEPPTGGLPKKEPKKAKAPKPPAEKEKSAEPAGLHKDPELGELARAVGLEAAAAAETPAAAGSGRKTATAPEKAGALTGRTVTRELWDWGRTLLAAVVVVLLLHFFVFNLSTVEGQSMQPTLYDKEWLYVNLLSYRLGSPQIGDVVILKDPSNGPEKKDFLVKRIVGEPGDTMEVRSGRLYRNGQPVAESYTDTPIQDPDFGPEKVGAGYYFVMGDNRHASASRDSRYFGPVPRTLIQGKADFIIWPIAKWNKL